MEERVVGAAEAALADHQYVSVIDVLTRMGLLLSAHVEEWRRRRIPYLETFIQGSPEKISRSLQLFQDWARNRGLKPGEIAYLAGTRGPAQPLQFTASGDPETERFYRTHYVSPELSQRKVKELKEKLSQPPELVVFSIIRQSQCSQCEAELAKGSFLIMEADHPLCMTCADMDHLVFLPSGDTALTRRARKHSSLSAVVVRFNRARKRYERQGVLVQEAALKQAEEECLSDTDLRARRREQEALRRAEEDQELIGLMAERMCQMFPGCPARESRAIAAHAAARGSGRVGRSAAGRALDEGALRLAVIASVRHHHTRYDELLMRGWDRASARHEIQEQIEKVLRGWEVQKNAANPEAGNWASE